jgi:hypothetical protein
MPKNPRKPKKTDIGKPWQKQVEPKSYKINRQKITDFFIICEGHTEKLYFRSFPVKSAEVQSVALGTTPPNIVKYAKRNGREYDQIWCVFDMDYNPQKVNQKAQFDNAVDAEKGKLRCAYSNDSFELWFVLHFQSCEQAELRTRHNDILSGIWKIDYSEEGKKEQFAENIYQRLLNDDNASQAQAIERAKQLDHDHEGKPPHQQNPTTTVYKLVEELNKCL